MADLHETMGLGNLATGSKGSGPIHARRTMKFPEIPKPTPAKQDNQAEANHVLEKLQSLQESEFDSDPTGMLDTLRTTNG